MRVHVNDQICREKHVKIIRKINSEVIDFCIFADDDEGYYEQNILHADGSIEVKTVIESIRIEICDRPEPPQGYTYNVE